MRSCLPGAAHPGRGSAIDRVQAEPHTRGARHAVQRVGRSQQAARRGSCGGLLPALMLMLMLLMLMPLMLMLGRLALLPRGGRGLGRGRRLVWEFQDVMYL
jgi:hypothetical protein